jgi:ectoine hydroxylase-related dioxygenase (phytanoyl-CoA dioxygenase family)
MTTDFHNNGLLWLRGALSTADCETLGAALGPENKPGARRALDGSENTALSPITKAIQANWPNHRPVRLVSFDKSNAVNWAVPWHQDRIITVKERVDMDGYTNWSQKAGVWHCEPPLDVLNKMLFVRVHLDGATAENGAMEIALGSHKNGAVPSGQADTIAQRHTHALTTAEAGDILILPMLTLHRSRTSKTATPRRTLRIDYAANALPPPLQWAA